LVGWLVGLCRFPVVLFSTLFVILHHRELNWSLLYFI
jgi:hypothetical protein